MRIKKSYSRNNPSKSIKSSCAVLILAAGLGKRMRSDIPKVLQPISGKPVLFHILKTVLDALPEAPIGVVIGTHGSEIQKACMQEYKENKKINFILQPEPQGTGDAVRCAMQSTWGKNRLKEKASILVLPGDTPLIPKTLLKEMTLPLKAKEVLRLLTCQMLNPFSYGRIIRSKINNAILRIVEEKDASTKEKKIQEVAVSIYFFQSHFISDAIQKLSSDNIQNEYYLTQVIELAFQSQEQITSLEWLHPNDLKGVNTPLELLEANQCMQSRSISYWVEKGVFFSHPFSVELDITVELKPGVKIGSGVILRGNTSIEENTIIEPHVILENVQVGRSVQIKTGSVIKDSILNNYAQVGPYAHLRPHCTIGENARIGNFVELKNASIGAKTKIAHLSYIGDAQVGNSVNIGCGFITCNFDGRTLNGKRKHETLIEDEVFLGSDCQVIAPIKIGKGAYIASGSTITDEVPAASFVIARSRQVTKLNYAKKFTGILEAPCVES